MRQSNRIQAPPRPLVLLISGWAGSGKDAAAALLAEELGFTRHSFASALKREASDVTGISLYDFDTHGLKDTPMSDNGKPPREILLAHAAAARESDPDVYAKAVARDIELVDAGRAVISDWRMENEREYLIKHFPQARIVTLRITRKMVEPRPEAIEHELDKFPFDIRIANDGCISDLRDALRHTLRPHLGATTAASL